MLLASTLALASLACLSDSTGRPDPGPNYQFPWGDALPQSLDPVPANFLDLVGDIVDVENYPSGVTAWDPAKAIYQMAGNANEWVHDLYDPDYYDWANTNGDNTNPTGFRCVTNLLPAQ